MKILLIGLLITSCSCFAGTLPADFHFRAPSNERISIITQLKEYEEEKARQKNCEQELSVKPFQDLKIIQKNNEHDMNFFKRCKKFIMELIGLLSMKRE